MCGNGGRCIAAFAMHMGVAAADLLFEFDAIDGRHYAIVKEDKICLKMADVSGIQEIPEGFFLNTGSPHVVLLKDDVSLVDVYNVGKEMRYDERFSDGGGTNVNFLTIKNDDLLAVRTYERGVEDETWSCGTGSVASAMVASYLNGSRNEFNIDVPGGKLHVRFDIAGKGVFKNVWLEGPAVFVFEGDFKI